MDIKGLIIKKPKTKPMEKKYFILNVLFILSFFLTEAANIKIDKEASIIGIDTAGKTAYISFDLSWENSWRQSDGAANRDGVWLFVKFREKDSKEWKHVYLNTSASGFSIESDNKVTPEFSAGITDNKGVGVFAYRKNDGSGNINWDGFKMKWNYGMNGVKNINNVEVKVFAIEMVYVSKGAFKLGSGGAEYCAFYTYPSLTVPYGISSEGPVTIGQKDGDLYYAKHFYCDMYTATIPAEFPKGYNAFWCMKYEVTQEQYVEFLNTLNRQQQSLRVIADITKTKVGNYFVMCNDKKVVSRNGIRCDSVIPVADPVTFYCDLNSNGKPNESNDGQNISCNFLGWADGAAYTDWAGLRPMTEFEYEKACRGSQNPVANEYSWGSTKILTTESLLNAGSISESASSSEANCMFDNPAKIQGPVRSGMFYRKDGTKEQNGESYFGIADLSGNLFERCVTVSNSTGIAFKGTYGDGTLDASGNFTNADWPNTLGVGAGYRGGSYFYTAVYCRTSDRQYAGLSDNSRFYHYGFRAVRNAN
jgi:formylglycine-generating enzyme required for sulfatase activity